MSESAATGAAVERSAIPVQDQWNLDRIFPDIDSWEAEFAAIEAELAALEALRGSLSKSGAALLAGLDRILDAGRRLEVVYVHASMTSDQDTRVGENTARKGRAGTLSVRYAEATSWLEPELLALDDAKLERFLAEEPGLELYDHYLDDIRRHREHTLDPGREALLAAAGNMARGASAVFSALDNADIKFPAVPDEKGRRVELTKARYTRLVRADDREVRRGAFEAFMDTYGGYINTLAANLDSNIRNHVFFARARNYADTLEAALHPNAVPVSVFHSLIETVNANIETIHRYTRLKKRVLGLDRLREFDLYVPLFTAGRFSFDYRRGCGTMLEALAPLGDEYLEVVRKGLGDRWIDVHENQGKRSGAYSSGAYGTDPYILLNWSDQLRDTFTLAHEMGHSMHSWLASHNQPYVYGDYPIFTAEVASTFNEALLMDHLLATTDDRDRRLFLLDVYLDQINSTVFRQTMFAEFELAAHRAGEAGETLTADWLDETYMGILGRYWGPEAELDPARSPRTWCRIPHFYYKYYVYQYATAFAASTALSRRVQAGGTAEREQYLGFMRSGNSRYPVDTLARAGVDVTGPGPVEDVFALFSDLLDEAEKLIEPEVR